MAEILSSDSQDDLIIESALSNFFPLVHNTQSTPMNVDDIDKFVDETVELHFNSENQNVSNIQYENHQYKHSKNIRINHAEDGDENKRFNYKKNMKKMLDSYSAENSQENVIIFDENSMNEPPTACSIDKRYPVYEKNMAVFDAESSTNSSESIHNNVTTIDKPEQSNENTDGIDLLSSQTDALMICDSEIFEIITNDLEADEYNDITLSQIISNMEITSENRMNNNRNSTREDLSILLEDEYENNLLATFNEDIHLLDNENEDVLLLSINEETINIQAKLREITNKKRKRDNAIDGIEIIDPSDIIEPVQFGGGANEENNYDNNDLDVNDQNTIQTFEILSETARFYNHLEAAGLRVCIRIEDPLTVDSSLDNNDYIDITLNWLNRVFSALLIYIRDRLNVEQNDKIGMRFIRSEQDSFNISFRLFSQYSVDLILSSIANVLQSNREFFFIDSFNIQIDHIKMPIGRGRSRFYNMRGFSLQQYAKGHPKALKLVETLEGSEYLCLAYALALGVAHADDDKSQCIAYENRHALHLGALELCIFAETPIPKVGGGIYDVRRFQRGLYPNYQITLFGDRKGEKILYRCENIPGAKRINLLYEDNHYLLIKSLNAAFNLHFYCEMCCKGYASRSTHKSCPYSCPCCYSKPPCARLLTEKTCEQCNRSFRGNRCFEKHLKFICKNYKVCNICFKAYKFQSKKPHQCGLSFCYTCRKDVPTRHECFLAPAEKKVKREETLYIFYDIESTQESPLVDSDESFEHYPNLLVSQQVCAKCDNIESNEYDCFYCGNRQKIFESKSCVGDFLTYMVNINQKFKKIIAIAHNSKAYDSHFILRYMYTNNEKWCMKTDSMVTNGTNILKLAIDRYSFIDSHNYFMAPLAALPKMFKLNETKGDYPHKFNKIENYNYIGQIPDLSYYDPDSKSPEERNKLIQWLYRQNQ